MPCSRLLRQRNAKGAGQVVQGHVGCGVIGNHLVAKILHRGRLALRDRQIALRDFSHVRGTGLADEHAIFLRDGVVGRMRACTRRSLRVQRSARHGGNDARSQQERIFHGRGLGWTDSGHSVTLPVCRLR
jgi:hypothetical protein